MNEESNVYRKVSDIQMDDEPVVEHGIFVPDDHPLSNTRLVKREIFDEPLTIIEDSSE